MDLSWQIEEVAWPANVVAAAEALAARGELAWLDSAVSDPRRGRYSLLATNPCAILEQFDGQVARLVRDGHVLATAADAWRLWQETHAALPRLWPAPGGITPGWVGYVGFEMARGLERLPASHRADLGLPLLRLGLYDRGIVLDHLRRRAYALTAPGVAAALGTQEQPAHDWLQRWSVAVKARRMPRSVGMRELRFETTRAEHERRVRAARAHIAAGDIYQVNLAHRLHVAGVDDALAAYADVRQSNPAAYAALLRWSDGAVASVSPELFLAVRGDRLLTRPIKGTRPRVGQAAADDVARWALLQSPKEAAELAMIVDLHRNDLGRVCRFGSVQVPHARRLEAHPTVFHTVADVVGRLRPECDALMALRACFPAGSISGVPKIRAIEIIDELEPVARGAYTGAIGVLGLDGQMTFNVAIRTLQIHATTATLYVGGGIVADSEPAAEYAETLAKARGILRGLGVAVPATEQVPMRAR